MKNLTRLLGSIALLSTLNGCAMEVTDEEVLTVEQELKNATYVNVGNHVVTLINPDLAECTAVLINKNSLLTAAHCGLATYNSNTRKVEYRNHVASYKVLQQRSTNVWRCLSGTATDGAFAAVAASCPAVSAQFTTKDNGPITYTPIPGDGGGTKSVAKNDLGILHVTNSSFAWRGTTNSTYAAIWDTIINHGVDMTLYAAGPPSDTVNDHRVRKDFFTVDYRDQFVIGSHNDSAIICAGDSGSPLGVTVSGTSSLFAVMGVTSWTVDKTDHNVTCSGQGEQVTFTNVSARMADIEAAIGKRCPVVNYGFSRTRQCWL